MKKDNKDDNFVLMEIQIWNNKASNGMFLYNNNLAEFKKVYFTFDQNQSSCYLIKTKDNYIQTTKEHKDFDESQEMKFYLELEKV